MTTKTDVTDTMKLVSICEGPYNEHFCDLDNPCLHDCGDGCHDPTVARNTFGEPIPGPDDVHYLNDGCDSPHGQGVAPLDLSTN